LQHIFWVRIHICMLDSGVCFTRSVTIMCGTYGGLPSLQDAIFSNSLMVKVLCGKKLQNSYCFFIWNFLYSFIKILRDIFNIMSFSCFMCLGVTVSLQNVSWLINRKGKFFIIYARRYIFCCYSYCKAHQILTMPPLTIRLS